jgi:hypothetical protein
MAAISPAVRPADTTVSIICGAAMINKYIYCHMFSCVVWYFVDCYNNCVLCCTR